MSASLPWIRTGTDSVSISIDLTVYSLEATLRACHVFTARCFVLARRGEGETVVVDFASRDGVDDLRTLAGEFSNTLLDYRLRATISEETRAIRELLVAQAFCEADLLDRRDSNADEHADPRRIAQ